MKDHYSDLIELLKKDERLLSSENTLLKNEVINLSNHMDDKLLKLLLENDETKKMFFVEVGNTMVFDKQKFNWVINSRAFLPDSYTSYSQSIGLIDAQGSFIKKCDDVVLAFPNKDCFLEFDSTEENEKRKEIFFNETLAKSEIDTLKDNKVFVNAKKIDKDGENQITVFDKNDNLLIKGNNLLAMYSLLPRYKKQIKFMYWDILYNTNNDTVPYNDNFKHSSWLVMMKNRLEVAKELLSRDGVIFIQCDDNEQAYLKVLCDEVLGRDNFVNCIAVKMSEATGVKMSHANLRFPKLKEYILFYKRPEFKGFETIDKYLQREWDSENNIFLENFTKEDRNKIIELTEKESRTEEDVNTALKILKNVNKKSLAEKIKELKLKDSEVQDWCFDNAYRIIKTCGSDSLLRLVNRIGIDYDQEIACALSTENVMFFYITDYNKEARSPRLRVIFADENIYKNPCDFWQDIKTTGSISNEGGVALSNGKKPEKILYRLIKMTTKPGDLCLDAYMGTATTAAVAMKMGRRFITIEQLDSHVEKGITRIKNVIAGDSTGISKDAEWNGGGSFVYLEMAKNNMNYITKFQNAKKEELTDIFKELTENELLNYRVDKEILKNNESGFNELSEDEQRNLLIEILDKNLLYINYSDIEDEDYSISEEDKEFNKSYYQE